MTYTSESSAEKTDQLVARIAELENGSKAVKIKADLRDTSSPKQIVEATLAAFPGDAIDILVNNAGCLLTRNLGDITHEDFAYIYDLNVRATVFMTQEILPYLRRPGRIVNIGSVGARGGFPGYSLYGSSKAAMEALTRSWATELGPKGHTVNVVHPGPTETDMVTEVTESIVTAQKKATPMENRMGTVDDVAQIVAFLAEERSRWVTGQSISASGGYAMY